MVYSALQMNCCECPCDQQTTFEQLSAQSEFVITEVYTRLGVQRTHLEIGNVQIQFHLQLQHSFIYSHYCSVFRIVVIRCGPTSGERPKRGRGLTSFVCCCFFKALKNKIMYKAKM